MQPRLRADVDFPLSRCFECRVCHQAVRASAVAVRRDRTGAMWGYYRCEPGHETEIGLTLQDYEALKAALEPEPRHA